MFFCFSVFWLSLLSCCMHIRQSIEFNCRLQTRKESAKSLESGGVFHWPGAVSVRHPARLVALQRFPLARCRFSAAPYSAYRASGVFRWSGAVTGPSSFTELIDYRFACCRRLQPSNIADITQQWTGELSNSINYSLLIRRAYFPSWNDKKKMATLLTDKKKAVFTSRSARAAVVKRSFTKKVKRRKLIRAVKGGIRRRE